MSQRRYTCRNCSSASFWIRCGLCPSCRRIGGAAILLGGFLGALIGALV